MSSFTYVHTEALRTLKRPDLTLQVAREINNAILFFSGDADYDEDVVEVSLNINALQYTQALDFSQFVRFRKMDYLKQGRCELRNLDRSQIFSCSQSQLVNRWYLVGAGFRFSLGNLSSTLDAAYFQYPPITDAAIGYWMFAGGWNFILDRVLAKVFKDIGDVTSADKHERFAVAAYAAFRADKARKASL